MKAVFPRVIDNGKMLRNFVQIVRSGVVGRKSLGTAPKRAAQAWFASRTPESDLPQLARRAARRWRTSSSWSVRRRRTATARRTRSARRSTATSSARTSTPSKLPPVVRAFEAFKKGEGALPDVPFEMLTALELTKEHWSAIAKHDDVDADAHEPEHAAPQGRVRGRGDGGARGRASPQTPRPSGARAHSRTSSSRRSARRARRCRARSATLCRTPSRSRPRTSRRSRARSYVCPDVSGSMQSPVTGHRGSATSAVRCVDVAGLVAASLLRREPGRGSASRSATTW